MKSSIILKRLNLIFFLPFTYFSLFACGPQNPRAHNSNHHNEGWIGVFVQNLDDDLRDYYDIDEHSGVMINDVIDDGPADKAGLQAEDVITKFDGKRIRNIKDLTRAIKKTEPGKKINVELVRDNHKEKLKIKIDEKPKHSYSYNSNRDNKSRNGFNFSFGKRPWLGIRMADLNDDLADYFDANGKDGVLILDVIKDSPAKKAGLKSGDIITQIDDHKIRATEDLTDALEDYDSGDEITIRYIHKTREKSVKVELGERHFGSKNWRSELNDLKTHFNKERIEELNRKINRYVRKNIDINIPLHDLELKLEGLEDLNINLEHLENDLELQFDGLRKEMQQLSRELENMTIWLHIQSESI